MLMAERENAIYGTVNGTRDPCVFQVQHTVQNGSAFKQIDFRRVQNAAVEIPAGRRLTQRLTLSGDLGIYCQGVLSSDDAKRSAIALRSGRSCRKEMVLWDGDSRVPLERVARAALYISQNFCPYGGKPY